MILIYEIGSLIYATDYTRIITTHGVDHAARTQYITARLWLHQFFEWFGAGGYWLPGLAVVAILLTLHLVHKHPWEFDWRIYRLMLVESIWWALPLLAFGILMAPRSPAWAMLSSNSSASISWQSQVLFSLGAGIYEELVFRLVAITFLHWLLVDILAIPDRWGSLACVLLSAIAFSLYHYSADRAFGWGLFSFYTIAGLYLAGLFLLRGMGVASGAHAMYDLYVVMLKFMR